MRNGPRILQQLNTVQGRAIIAGLGMATGQQLTDDPTVNAGILLAFLLGGIADWVYSLVKSSRSKDDTEGSR